MKPPEAQGTVVTWGDSVRGGDSSSDQFLFGAFVGAETRRF